MIYTKGQVEDGVVHHLVIRGKVFHARYVSYNSTLICLEHSDLIGTGATLESKFRNLADLIEKNLE